MAPARMLIASLTCVASGACEPALEVGPGFTDVSPRQLVRTQEGILYAVVPTCDAYPDCPGSELRAWRADRAVEPQSFRLVDPGAMPRGGIGSAAAALDDQGRIQVAWVTRDGHARAAFIDPATDRWSAPVTLEATNWTDFGQGDQGVALAVDAAGSPHACWNRREEGSLRIRCAFRDGEGWTPAQTVDLPAPGPRRNAWHPTLAFGPDGTLWLSWLEGSGNYKPDGIIRVRSRGPDGAWRVPEDLAEPAMTGIDNGPSLLVTADGTVHLAFAGRGNEVRYRFRDASGWHAADPPLTRTHNPSLGPDGRGGVWLYAHGPVPADDLASRAVDLLAMHRPPGGSWGSWQELLKGRWDCSVAPRWAQFHHALPGLLDFGFWDDRYPNTLWVGINTL